ncbi:MAG: PDGLE domain-containing protein, partial [Nitrospirota bacterium]
LLPDYSFPSKGEEGGSPAWPAADAGTSISGIVGSILVLGLVLVFAAGIKAMRRLRHKQ